ncbi:polysaccharide pyruvyl transferase CsaB [candidate division WOR-1 bacterium RIFOXYA12_FULL_43_27]|uniref:Polysaccharide pyruvyl transferase CsaB n=1 Tax=candidate division WOR-1 bacterium RIFOXYC2_FULL_46_14 TaxID=1802587 RepID=A0A1F4U863_UNCSA|nr:MAG: polysaccharide pyruvyl transferase CsaB [candidate division WOR-1 bacterium RIFOXYA12_FULL_43_27]OGC20032.1 MAG: polysaccharide pyruvyl transferase CsaB [candidate division WOR-1 bacterium RIFOXYB2_FULL_46_45]OGC32231.1 MAG: polysaccharide pyruvyl transferase CsaB [candidate division WOR-1 bacterium RIFOXYA2_FULL_46_56]OGC41135.1 MAG: polysaccharide pyruvyl transferase CsaB [candidate division WOR-1 bacterium RIFOXYC2_FULL_46_14]
MKLLLSGYYGFGNTGDEAILQAIKLGFKDFQVSTSLSDLFSCDAFISGGGSLFQDKTSYRSFWYYLGLLALAQFLRKKTVVFAQGIGPIRSKVNLFFLKMVFSRCNLITLRDKDSYDLVKSFNLKKPRVELTADLAFILPIREKKQKTGKTIGISIRTCDGSDKLFPKIAETADLLADKYHAEIAFLPFQPSVDESPCLEIMKKMKHPARIIAPEKINQLSFLIGMRLHALIFAVANQVPSYGISYDPKVESFMKDTGLPYSDVFDFKAEDLFQKFDQKIDLGYIRNQMKSRSEKNFTLVKTLLKEESWKS